jgi:small-conductance mechanosensitive channel
MDSTVIFPPDLHTLWEWLPDWRQDLRPFVRHDLPKIFFVIVGAVLLIRLLRALSLRAAGLRVLSERADLRAQQLRTLAGVINSVGSFVILFVALLEVMSLLGFNLGPLLASAGIAGVAIGFGAQTLVKDVLNGFFILLENQYALGDTVRTAGVQGKVEEITLRRTVLRDDDGTVHFIANSQIGIVSNLTRDWAQVSLRTWVAYSENSEKIVELLRQAGASLWSDPQYSGGMLEAPRVLGLDRVGDGAAEYLLTARTRPGDQYAISRELRWRIKSILEENQVKPAGPGRVYVQETAN